MPHIVVFTRALVRAHPAHRFGLGLAVDSRVASADQTAGPKSETFASELLVPTRPFLPRGSPDWRCSDFDLSFCNDGVDGFRVNVTSHPTPLPACANQFIL